MVAEIIKDSDYFCLACRQKKVIKDHLSRLHLKCIQNLKFAVLVEPILIN